jgi:hypothetical protein
MQQGHGVRRRLLLRAGGLAGAVAAGAGAAVADAASAHAATPAATGTFNVMDYGASGTGQQDDTAAIQAAVDAASAAGGGVVLLPPGTYWRGGATVVVPGGVRIVGAGPGATNILDRGGSWPCLKFAGSNGADVPLAADATRHGITLSVATTGVSAGDLLLVGANTPSNASRPEFLVGEFVRVKSVDSASQLTIWGQLRDVYTTAGKAFMRPVTPAVGNGLADLSMVTTDPNHDDFYVLAEYAEDFDVRNVVMRRCGSTGVGLHHVFGARITALHCYDQPDQVDSTYGTTLRYGYGIGVMGASEAVTITGCRFSRLRHGITTTGLANQHGRPRGIVVSGCVATHCTAPSFDTHEDAEDVTFTGCHAGNSTQSGYELRGRNCRVISCSASYSAYGVWVGATATGAEIRGCTFRNLGGPVTNNGSNGPEQTNAAGYGVMLTGPDNVLIEGNTFADLLRAGVVVSGPTCRRLRIVGNEILNPGRAGSATWGFYFDASLTLVSDVVIARNHVQAFPTVVTDSDSTGSVTSVVRLDTPASAITSMLISDNTYPSATELMGAAGSKSSGITVEAPMFTDNAAKGLVLRSPNGTYWRMTVSDAGALGVANLGTTRPILP